VRATDRIAGRLGWLRSPGVGAKPVELILLRRLAARMPMPVILVDADGVLVYFNPATERMLGYDRGERSEFPISALPALGDPRDADNNPLPLERMPISVALHERRPQQATLIVHDADGTPHRIVTTAIPLDGQGGVLLGAMSIFWEAAPDEAVTG
jgi:PAS domain-containing protein